MDAISIYIHIPFCQKRCSYCDFNTYAGIDHLIPAYVSALEREIEQYGVYLGDQKTIHTLFFGGGTPSLLRPQDFNRLFSALNHVFDLSTISEISLEANPGTVTLDYLRQLKNLGFTRISFGVQSAHQEELDLLGRIHTFDQARQAIEWSQKAGFDNWNVDLIYGLPKQTNEKWLKTLEMVTEMQPFHLSIYALGIEEETPLHSWVQSGQVPAPDDDLSTTMYESGLEFLTTKGFQAYEISNLYRQDELNDYRCKHNLQYWHNLPYIGIGAGAHGFIKQQRTENVRGVPAYIAAMNQSPDHNSLQWSTAIENLTPIDRFTEMQETMMVGLRLLEEGVSVSKFTSRFGESPLSVFQEEIDVLLKKRLIEIENNEIIKLRSDRVMVSNLVFQYFV